MVNFKDTLSNWYYYNILPKDFLVFMCSCKQISLGKYIWITNCIFRSLCLHVSGFSCICRPFCSVPKAYASTRIPVRREFDTKTPESLTEHALRWWINRATLHMDGLFRFFTSSFANVANVTSVHTYRYLSRSQTFLLRRPFLNLCVLAG